MFCVSGNGQVLLDWILADVDIIPFLLQSLTGVNNHNLYEQLYKTTFLNYP